ncbi:MAG: hypothetical protein IPJ32_07530 [Sphingobacteriaceae bacterium]|nr:hypothetical protein [Sphingobacteriaceae bacterium]
MFTTKHKTIIVSVINDLATDQRVLRTCSVLEEYGFEVILFGRELENSPSVSHLAFKTKRVKMLFTKGPSSTFSSISVYIFFFYLIKQMLFLRMI